jgi:hypothetical protein
MSNTQIHLVEINDILNRNLKNRTLSFVEFDGETVALNTNSKPDRGFLIQAKNANKQLTAKYAVADRLRKKLEARQSKEIK